MLLCPSKLPGLPKFSDPQTLYRFSLHAPDSLWPQMYCVNDGQPQNFVRLPGHRSRAILDTTVITVIWSPGTGRRRRTPNVVACWAPRRRPRSLI